MLPLSYHKKSILSICGALKTIYSRLTPSYHGRSENLCFLFVSFHCLFVCCLKLISKASQMDVRAHAQSVSQAHSPVKDAHLGHALVLRRSLKICVKSNKKTLTAWFNFSGVTPFSLILHSNLHFLWSHCEKAEFMNLSLLRRPEIPLPQPPGPGPCSLDGLPWKSPVTSQTFYKSAEWLRWSINTPWIAPGGGNGHIRNSKKPKPRVHCEFCNNNTMDLVQWKMGRGPKAIIAAIVLLVTQSLKCNIQEGHFITSNRASIMCKICSLNRLAIISIISGYSEG